VATECCFTIKGGTFEKRSGFGGTPNGATDAVWMRSEIVELAGLDSGRWDVGNADAGTGGRGFDILESAGEKENESGRGGDINARLALSASGKREGKREKELEKHGVRIEIMRGEGGKGRERRR
jgi:hypothetical protein